MRSDAVQLADGGAVFDGMAELVPAKYYLPGEEETHYYHSQKEKMEARKMYREMAKASKMKRLDPDQIKTLEELQIEEEQKRMEERKKPRNEHPSHDDAAPTATGEGTEENKNGEAGFDALRERLQKRIQELRAKRKAEQQSKTKQSALQWKKERNKQTLERAKKADKKEDQSVCKQEKKRKHRDEQHDQGQEAEREAGTEFQFSKVNLPEPEWEKRKRSKINKHSKEELLEKAVAMKEELEKSKDTEEGKMKAKKVALDAAYLRATGQKVLDDPKLLRKSIRREQKEKLKSAQAWSERNRRVEEAKEAKQQKRSSNLKTRRDTKIERKIAKREKKLTRRPGFEGEIKGFVNAAKQ